MYASYEFYTETFGGSLTETDFRKYELRAEVYIRYLTYVNGDIFAKEDNRVKMAVCAAAEVVADAVRSSSMTSLPGRALKSETTDGYSVSYADGPADLEVELRKNILEAIEIYLLPTGWLCRVMSERSCCDYECGSDDL